MVNTKRTVKRLTKRPPKKTIKSRLRNAAGLNDPKHLALKAKLDKSKAARKKLLDRCMKYQQVEHGYRY